VPAPQPTFGLADAQRHVAERCVGPAVRPRPPEHIGLELEWLTIDVLEPDHRFAAAALDRFAQAGGRLPGGSQVTVEPGGQIELDTEPLPSLTDAIATAHQDAAALQQRLAELGARLVPVGIDPWRSAERTLDAPRYAAMEASFDAVGSAGRAMMCNTAALQVNLDLGPDGGRERWSLLDAVGPALAAAFANSPVSNGRPTGFRSTRLATWAAIDPTRTAAVPCSSDPVAAWLDYALHAQVLLHRLDGERFEPVLDPLTFAGWIQHGHAHGWPTDEDWAYHLTTLFPPVRPRGWLEVRYLDALPDEHWPVAVAVLWALALDPEAGQEARLAVCGTEGRWTDAARHAAGDPELGQAGARCLDAAAAGLERLGEPPALAASVRAFAHRFPHQRRCPADDVLDAHRHGRLLAPTDVHRHDGFDGLDGLAGSNEASGGATGAAEGLRLHAGQA
jgi:glutamate--cysteine ligase